MMKKAKLSRRELCLFLMPLLVVLPLIASTIGKSIYYKHFPLWLDQGKDSETVQSLSFSPDGKILTVFATGGFSKNGVVSKNRAIELQVWDSQNGELVSRQQLNHPLGSISFAADNQVTTSSRYDGSTMPNYKYTDRSPNGELVARYSREPSLGYKGCVTLVRVRDGQQLRRQQIGDIGSLPSPVAFLNNDEFVTCGGKAHPSDSAKKQVIVNSTKSHMQVWDVGSGRLLRSFPCEITVQDFALSPDRKWLSTVALVPNKDGIFIGSVITMFDAKSGVRKWRVRKVQTSHEVPNDGAPSLSTWAMKRLEFSPDSNTLAAGGYSGFIRLLDVQTGEVIRTLHDPAKHSANGLIRLIAFSPDGTKLAAAQNFSSVVKLWDITDVE